MTKNDKICKKEFCNKRNFGIDKIYKKYIILYTMNAASILIKTDPRVKQEAQKTAKELGLSLSAVLNALLKQFIQSKTITFSQFEEEPSEYLLKEMKQARENRKAGKGSPLFTSDVELIKKDPKKYRHINTMPQWFEEQEI